MPDEAQSDPSALVKQIRGYVQRREIDYDVAMGLTLTALADVLEAFQTFKRHTHPELRWIKGVIVILAPVMLVGALSLFIGLLTHRIGIVFAVP
jgi:hypothetical protein